MKTICLLVTICWCACAQDAGTMAPVASAHSEADPTGPDVFGVFVGRTPCQALAREMNVSVSDECIKRKWTLILFQDPKSHQPTTYKLFGAGYLPVPREGKWEIVSGSKEAMYRLDGDGSKAFLSFLKADENVILFAGRDGKPLVGNVYYSYALYRADGRN